MTQKIYSDQFWKISKHPNAYWVFKCKMTTRQIFMIDKGETTEQQPDIRRNWRMTRKSCNPHINYWSGFHVFTILFSCALALSILTMIPRHNSILDQSYWFEMNIVTVGSCFMWTAGIVLDFIVLFGKSSLVTVRFFLKNYLASFLTWIVGFCGIYIIWKMILEYNHPMPWYGAILYLPVKIVSVVSVPLLLPREFSHEEESKEKLKSFIWFELGWMPLAIIKILLAATFEKLKDTDAQCLIALLIPISKRFASFYLSKLMNRIVGSDNERANCNLTSQINLSYGLFIATSLIGARPATVVCMVAVDALMQLIMTYQIVKMHKTKAVY